VDKIPIDEVLGTIDRKSGKVLECRRDEIVVPIMPYDGRVWVVTGNDRVSIRHGGLGTGSDLIESMTSSDSVSSVNINRNRWLQLRTEWTHPSAVLQVPVKPHFWLWSYDPPS